MIAVRETSCCGEIELVLVLLVPVVAPTAVGWGGWVGDGAFVCRPTNYGFPIGVLL